MCEKGEVDGLRKWSRWGPRARGLVDARKEALSLSSVYLLAMVQALQVVVPLLLALAGVVRGADAL